MAVCIMDHDEGRNGSLLAGSESGFVFSKARKVLQSPVAPVRVRDQQTLADSATHFPME